MALIIILAVVILIAIAYFSPKLAIKLYPAPTQETSVLNVHFPHGLKAEQYIKVDDEILEVVDVKGSQITVRKALAAK